MEAYFSNFFQDVWYERTLILLLSLTDPEIFRQTKFTDHEINMIKNLAPEKLHRQRNLKEYVARDLLEKHKIDNV